MLDGTFSPEFMRVFSNIQFGDVGLEDYRMFYCLPRRLMHGLGNGLVAGLMASGRARRRAAQFHRGVMTWAVFAFLLPATP